MDMLANVLKRFNVKVKQEIDTLLKTYEPVQKPKAKGQRKRDQKADEILGNSWKTCLLIEKLFQVLELNKKVLSDDERIRVLEMYLSPIRFEPVHNNKYETRLKKKMQTPTPPEFNI